MDSDSEARRLTIGETVYDENGKTLGSVRGVDEHGFYVTAADRVELLERSDVSHTDALMWRCWQCGEMGQLGEIPENCPACGAPREEIYYWQED